MTRPSRGLQLVRAMQLLRELQRHPSGCHYREMARALGYSERTAYRDLNALRLAGWPVVKGKRQGVWRLEDSGVPGIMFTPQELTALTLARSMLAGVPGSPFDAALRQAFQKIRSATDREGLRTLEASDRRFFMDLRHSRPYTRSEVWFRTMMEAIRKSETLRMSYFTLERRSDTEREVDPYGMVFHEGAFYLVGWCHWRREVRTFLVDRVRAVHATGKRFEMPPDFSVSDHFRNAWGLIKGRALVTIRVRFASSVAPVIREGRWHHSQQVEEGPGGSVILTVRVAGWEEIKRWLLGFGASAVVLEPTELREALAGEADRMRDVYSGGRGRRGRAATGN